MNVLIENHEGLQNYQSRELKKSVRNSFIIHGALLASMFISSVILPKKQVTLQSSVRVDLVDLPDFTKKELMNAKPADMEDLSKKLTEAKSKTEEALEKMREDAKKEPAPDPAEMALKKQKPKGSESLKSAIDRIKALQNIEESLAKAKGRKNLVKAKGNVLSKGSSMSGTQGDFYNEYADQMKNRLQGNWDLPIWLSRQKLSAQVVVLLDKYGNVLNTTFVRSSGNKQFDEQVLKAIRASQPFGPPPSEIIDNGVQLGFPL